MWIRTLLLIVVSIGSLNEVNILFFVMVSIHVSEVSVGKENEVKVTFLEMVNLLFTVVS